MKTLRNVAATGMALWLLLLFFAPKIAAQNLEGIGKQKPFRLGSGFALTAGAYAANGIEDRQNPYTWALAGSPSVEVYGIRFPFSFVISNQHRAFQQPFNQFGVTPTWRWIKVHAGYSTARFSPYTLAGRRFLGGGVELTPGKFRFGFVSGRFQKAVAMDSSAQLVPGQYLSNVPIPAFSRYGYAAKIGVGSRKTFFDISYLKAQDRTASIQVPESAAPRPEENAVLGVSTQITLFKRITWRGEVAGSAYTRDLNSDTIDLTGIGPAASLVRKILAPRNSTQVLTAGETSLGYKDKVFGLRVGYRRIDPDFKSMGAYFFQTDMEQWTLAPSLNLFRQKLQLGGSIGFQKNNLAGGKTNTTSRTIGSANANFNPSQRFGIAATFSNYGVTQKPRASLAPVLVADTLRLGQVARSMSLAPHWFLGGKQVQHNFGFALNYNTINDLNKISAYPSEMNTGTGNAFYSLNLPTQKLSVNAGFLLQRTESVAAKTGSTGFNVGGNRQFADDKLSLGLTAGWYRNTVEGGAAGSTQQLGGNMNWKLTKWGALFASATWLRTAGATAEASFSEVVANGGLSFSF